MPPNLDEEIEAFLGRENTPNDQAAFENPYDFRCVVGLPDLKCTGQFQVVEGGMTIRIGGQMLIIEWDSIVMILVKPHTTKVWTATSQDPIVIVGAVRPAILGAVHLIAQGVEIRMTHALHLEAGDEGKIWIKCACGWHDSLGYTCTVAEVWGKEQEHRRTIGEPLPSVGTLVC